MKLKFETVIDADVDSVWAAFDNPDNMSRWQQNLESFNHISGEPGQPGAVSELVYDEKGKKVVLTKEITERRAPNFMAGAYESLMGTTLIVNHFEAVAIVPLDQEGNTWLVGQERYTLGEYSWELPMGGAPIDEEPVAAARRELKEETGLTAKRWSQVLRLHTSNSITDEEGIVFVAEGLKHGMPEFDETEDLQIRKLPLAEALEMVGRGDITDAISVAALLHVANARKSFWR